MRQSGEGLSWGLNPDYPDIHSLRTRLRQCVWEVVLSAVTILSMSLFTVITIVLVVTTIAKAGIHF